MHAPTTFVVSSLSLVSAVSLGLHRHHQRASPELVPPELELELELARELELELELEPGGWPGGGLARQGKPGLQSA